MRKRYFGLAGVVLLFGAWQASAAMPFFKRAPILASFPIPIEEISIRGQEVRQVLQNPTVTAAGPAEVFACQPEQYYFFLEHPDRAVIAWRRLGAKCVSISDRGGGQFGWGDEYGSDVSWETVHKAPNLRIWYAHGKVRPAPMLPMVPVEIVLVLHHAVTRAAAGPAKIEHHAELYLHTDSKTAVLFARLMGTSTNRLAEQGLSQLQLFFSALSWYLDQHPERAQVLMRELE